MLSPLGAAAVTGTGTTIISNTFARNTSHLFLNGLRQQDGVDYIEGSACDLISGSTYNHQ